MTKTFRRGMALVCVASILASACAQVPGDAQIWAMTCYSGGVRIGEWSAERDGLFLYDSGWSVTDRTTGVLLRITADCVAELK